MAPWLWYFWIYSFLGWLVELAFAAAARSGDRRRRCLLFLPLCPVYGLGMLAVLAVLALPPASPLGLTVLGGLAATAVEYLYHWAGERFLNVRFWDYSRLPGNLRGRVCLPFTIAWGLLAGAAVRYVQPLAAALAAAVPPAATYAALMVFTADLVCSLYFLRVTGDLRAMRAALFQTTWNR